MINVISVQHVQFLIIIESDEFWANEYSIESLQAKTSKVASNIIDIVEHMLTIGSQIVGSVERLVLKTPAETV